MLVLKTLHFLSEIEKNPLGWTLNLIELFSTGEKTGLYDIGEKIGTLIPDAYRVDFPDNNFPGNNLGPVLNIHYEEELGDGSVKVVICNPDNQCMPAIWAGAIWSIQQQPTEQAA